MTGPVIVQKAPMPVEVEEGKNYFWCSCGRSVNQPFCDGSHKDTGMTPIKFTAPSSKKVFFCGGISVMALALNGLAMGMGVMYPDLKEDNPSKIVSGFGGTFCLVVSFVYIGMGYPP